MANTNQVPWPVWAIVTLLVAFIGAYAVIFQEQKNPPYIPAHLPREPRKPLAPTGQEDDLTPEINYNKEKAALKRTIQLASNAEISAFRKLDASFVTDIYGQDLLKSVRSDIRQLKSNGINLWRVLERQQFNAFNIYYMDGQLQAEVELTERWSGHYHRLSDNLCLSHEVSHNVPQTLYAEKRSDGWIITSVAFSSDNTPALIQCNTYECGLSYNY